MAKKRSGGSKGSPFERELCVKLSDWWTGQIDSDIFWRTAGSGGRPPANILGPGGANPRGPGSPGFGDRLVDPRASNSTGQSLETGSSAGNASAESPHPVSQIRARLLDRHRTGRRQEPSGPTHDGRGGAPHPATGSGAHRHFRIGSTARGPMAGDLHR